MIPPLLTSLSDQDRARLDAVSWYHTITVAPGYATPGRFDQRHAVPGLPFPDVRGKRCLDIGTWDGFYAYEMERRGAAEVVALDVADVTVYDYPPEVVADSDFDPVRDNPQGRSAGFWLLHELLGSRVKWTPGNVYDLSPDEFGTFDVIVMGSLLLHLRDPVRALSAIRSVCHGTFLSVEHLHPIVDIFARRWPLFLLRGEDANFQWWVGGDASVRHLLDVGGFEVKDESGRFVIRYGESPGSKGFQYGWRKRREFVLNRVLSGDPTGRGSLHRAYRCRPRF